MTHAEKEIRNQLIVTLRKQGQSMSQIAEDYGLTVSAVHQICKRYGVAGVMSDRKGTVKEYRNQYTSGAYDREENAKKYIEKISGYEYAGNYTGVDGFVDIRCKKCGHIQRKSMVSIRHGNQPFCPVCISNAKEKKRVEAAKARERERERKKQERYLSQKFTQLQFKICPVCNSMFVGKSTYCSVKCRNNNKWHMKEGYRNLFPLKEVYERDNGVCYLCGGMCDWNDYEERDGVIVYGNMYPSRDHIVPKSRGGRNAWDNIRLAHRICNSMKADSPLVKKEA